MKIAIYYCNQNRKFCGQCCHFTCRHMVGATADASMIVKCYKLQHRVMALNRLSIEYLVLLVSVDVSLLCCLVC